VIGAKRLQRGSMCPRSRFTKEIVCTPDFAESPRTTLRHAKRCLRANRLFRGTLRVHGVRPNARLVSDARRSAVELLDTAKSRLR